MSFFMWQIELLRVAIWIASGRELNRKFLDVMSCLKYSTFHRWRPFPHISVHTVLQRGSQALDHPFEATHDSTRHTSRGRPQNSFQFNWQSGEVVWLEPVWLEMRMRDGGIWSWMMEPVELDPSGVDPSGVDPVEVDPSDQYEWEREWERWSLLSVWY